MNKRGLSGIVTTVLIILLVVAAIAAIWLILRPSIKNTGTAVNDVQFCLNNKIEPLSCVRVTNTTMEGYNIAYRAIISSSNVERVNQTTVEVTFVDGTIGEVTSEVNLRSGGSENIAITSSNRNATKTKIIGTFLAKDGTRKACPSVEINCIKQGGKTLNYVGVLHPVGAPVIQSCQGNYFTGCGGNAIPCGNLPNITACQNQMGCSASTMDCSDGSLGIWSPETCQSYVGCTPNYGGGSCSTIFATYSDEKSYCEDPATGCTPHYNGGSCSQYYTNHPEDAAYCNPSIGCTPNYGGDCSDFGTDIDACTLHGCSYDAETSLCSPEDHYYTSCDGNIYSSCDGNIYSSCDGTTLSSCDNDPGAKSCVSFNTNQTGCSKQQGCHLNMNGNCGQFTLATCTPSGCSWA